MRYNKRRSQQEQRCKNCFACRLCFPMNIAIPCLLVAVEIKFRLFTTMTLSESGWFPTLLHDPNEELRIVLNCAQYQYTIQGWLNESENFEWNSDVFPKKVLFVIVVSNEFNTFRSTVLQFSDPFHTINFF